MKTINTDTLEIEDEVVTVESKPLTENDDESYRKAIVSALNCHPDEFCKKYQAFKKAEEEFTKIYEPFKEKLIELHKDIPKIPSVVVVGGVKLTYVSPSVRNSVDTKKLKEEEPELVKKFTKTTNVKASVRIDGVVESEV